MGIATTIELVSCEATTPYFTAILNRLRRIRAWFEAKAARQNQTKLDIIDRVRARAGLNQVERIRGQMHWQITPTDLVRARIISELEQTFGKSRDDRFVRQIGTSRTEEPVLELPGAKDAEIRLIAAHYEDPAESKVFDRAFAVIENIDRELGRSPSQNTQLSAPDPWMQPSFDCSFDPQLTVVNLAS